MHGEEGEKRGEEEKKEREVKEKEKKRKRERKREIDGDVMGVVVMGCGPRGRVGCWVGGEKKKERKKEKNGLE